MRRIPDKMREEMSQDVYMKRCCITNDLFPEWHHTWIYAGQQINEKWAIMPLTPWFHQAVHRKKELKEYVQYLSLKRSTKKDLEKYPKKNWDQLKRYLSKYKKFNLSKWHNQKWLD